MKTVLLSATALVATLATPAFAYPGQGGGNGGGGGSYTYTANNDGIGTYPVSATVADFCKLGTVQNTAGTNSSIDGSFATGDANVHVALQDSNDQAQAWNQSINIDNSICNRPFKIVMYTENGGMNNNTIAISNGQNFLHNVNYGVTVSFGGNGGTTRYSASSLHNNAQSVLTGGASVGRLTVALDGQANTNGYLLAGTYADTLHMTMSPNI